MSHEPSWLTDSTPATVAVPVADRASTSVNSSPTNQSSGNTTDPDAPPYKTIVVGIFAVINMGLMCLMGATGALGVKMANLSNGIDTSSSSSSNTQASVIFVGVYMCLFALILFLFELAQLTPCQMFDDLIKRNFGFLYGTLGKSFYTLFMGVLCFGLKYSTINPIATGAVICSWAGIQAIMYIMVPKYFVAKEKYIP